VETDPAETESQRQEARGENTEKTEKESQVRCETITEETGDRKQRRNEERSRECLRYRARGDGRKRSRGWKTERQRKREKESQRRPERAENRRKNMEDTENRIQRRQEKGTGGDVRQRDIGN
jgi:hypothetical protein